MNMVKVCKETLIKLSHFTKRQPKKATMKACSTLPACISISVEKLRTRKSTRKLPSGSSLWLWRTQHDLNPTSTWASCTRLEMGWLAISNQLSNTTDVALNSIMLNHWSSAAIFCTVAKVFLLSIPNRKQTLCSRKTTSKRSNATRKLPTTEIQEGWTTVALCMNQASTAIHLTLNEPALCTNSLTSWATSMLQSTLPFTIWM